LHAWRLKLSHPVSGQPLELQTELPEELQKWADSSLKCNTLGFNG
jgi:23S rRNA pseudouridine955/2504/2580 synthase